MRAQSLFLTLGLAGLTAALAAGPGPIVSGTLESGERQYFPQGCVHNGNHAVCSFVLVNQGQLVTLNAGAAMYGVQFVDSGHVPHGPDSAYFLDQWGSRQPQLVLQHNDRALLALEFASVDPAVTMGEFHLANQIVGGIGVAQPVYNAPQAPNGAMLASGGQMSGAQGQPVATGAAPAGYPAGQGALPNAAAPYPGQQAMPTATAPYPAQQATAYAQPPTYAQPTGYAQPAGYPQQQMAVATPQPCVSPGGGVGNALCNANNKMANTQNQIANGANQMAQSMQAVSQMGAAFRGMFGQRQANAAPAPAVAPAPQPIAQSSVAPPLTPHQ
jgi:hypothetical protein